MLCFRVTHQMGPFLESEPVPSESPVLHFVDPSDPDEPGSAQGDCMLKLSASMQLAQPAPNGADAVCEERHCGRSAQSD